MEDRIRLSYGGILPKQGELVSGGRVKLLHLGEIYPELNSKANILYLVSSAMPKNVSEVVKAAKKKGIKIVWNQNGVGYPAWAGKSYEKKNAPMREIIHQADWVIYQSQFSKNAADQFLGPFKGHSSILFNCADTTLFSPRAKSLPFRPIQLLVMGSHHQNQRVMLAIDTLNLLRKKNIRVKLTIGGRLLWGSHAKEEVLKRIASLGLDNDITLAGSYLQKDAPSLYRKSHILLHFKYNDPCPTVPIEAMYCGIPVIASDSGGMPELLKGSGGKTLKVPHNWEKAYYPGAEQAAEAVLAIMKDWKKRSVKTAAHAHGMFSKEKWLKSHTEIFTKLLK